MEIDPEEMAGFFEAERVRLRSIAYRMLGSLPEAEDAVQETWLRLARAGTADIDNLAAWLTTVVARICLNMLRDRPPGREVGLDLRLPDPVISGADGSAPEGQVLLADAVGLALQVVLDALAPAERVAFVLHDMFAVPFEDIALLVDRSVGATRQLASRGRRRVQDLPPPDPDLTRQRAVVDAFFRAARNGDFDGLVAVLDPQVVLRADGGRQARRSVVLTSVADVAANAVLGAKLAPYLQPALINGAAGAVTIINGKPISVLSFTVVGDRIVGIDILMDPERLAVLDFSMLLRRL